MKLLLTGSNGYLGCVVSRSLTEAGHEVICLDCADPTQTNPEQGLTYVKGDVRDPQLVTRLTSQADAIVHMAFIVGGPACARNEDLAKTTALLGTENVLSARGDRPLLFTSTDAVYGNAAHGVVPEDFPCAPASLYGQLKITCEDMIRQSDATWTILRLPSHFGPSPAFRPDLLVHWMVDQAIRGRIELFEAGVTRSLAHVRDSARAIVHFAGNPQRASGKLVNIASGSWSKLAIAEAVTKEFGGEIVLKNDAADEDKRDFVLDCSQAAELGYEPHYTLASGIRELREFPELFACSPPASL